MFKIRFPLRIRFREQFFINSLSPIFFYKFNITRIRFHELICEFGNLRKSSYEFTRLRFGSFLRNQCYVANGLYCTCMRLSQSISICYKLPHVTAHVTLHDTVKLLYFSMYFHMLPHVTTTFYEKYIYLF